VVVETGVDGEEVVAARVVGSGVWWSFTFWSHIGKKGKSVVVGPEVVVETEVVGEEVVAAGVFISGVWWSFTFWSLELWGGKGESVVVGPSGGRNRSGWGSRRPDRGLTHR
jgi:hypothetical protein